MDKWFRKNEQMLLTTSIRDLKTFLAIVMRSTKVPIAELPRPSRLLKKASP